MSGISINLRSLSILIYIWSLLKRRRKHKPLCRELKVNRKTSASNEDICRAAMDYTVWTLDLRNHGLHGVVIRSPKPWTTRCGH